MLLNNIKNDYILKNIFSPLERVKCEIIRYNKKLKKRLEITINHYKKLYKKYNVIEVEIILRSKYSLNESRLLSLIINSICFVISLIFDIIRIVKLNIKQYSYYIYIVIRIIKLILLCFLFTYSKKVLNSCFLSPYSIIAFRSIYETIFLTIFSIPLCFIKVYDFKDGDEEIIIFKNFLKYLTGSNLIYSILMLIDDYLIDIFSMLIIDKFSPSHLTLAMILESFAHMGYKIISKNVKGLDIYWNQYANLGIYVILLIGSMIHNEILVINKWGLNAKIQKSLNNEFINEIDSDMDLNEECENDDEKEKKEMSNID